MPNKRYRVQFPRDNASELGQDESFFYLIEEGEKRRIRMHDYSELYKFRGLYEQVVYDRLKCQSPSVVTRLLNSAVSQSQQHLTERRILDLGAGNGMMGAALKKYGVARLVGVDIIQEARDAAERDHPDIYDAYYVTDFCNLDQRQREDIRSWSLDCLTTVAALGFGDIPAQAFMEAFNLIQENGWVAFNIKETFLDRADKTGFSKLIRELIFSEYLDLCYLERYRHRFSVEGEPLYYFALSGRKTADVPAEFLDSINLDMVQ